jgi:hypothetical protein
MLVRSLKTLAFCSRLFVSYCEGFRTRHDVRLESAMRSRADLGESDMAAYSRSENEPLPPDGGSESGSVSGPLRAMAVASYRPAKPPDKR